jgi:hypothetical protein
LEAACEKLDIRKSKLEEALLLGTELTEENVNIIHKFNRIVEMSKMIQSIEDESKSFKSKVVIAKTTLKLLQVNETHLKGSTTQALNGNSQLREAAASKRS